MQKELENPAVQQSELIHISRNASSPNVIIVFSHVGYPPGKFALTRELSDINSTVVHLNCIGNAWYQEGLGIQLDSIDKLHGFLRDLIQDLAPARLITVGMSMGAYAAVLFGIRLGADAVLAFTPEIHLGLPHCRSWYLNDRKTYDDKHVSLAGLIAANTKTQVNAIYGAYDFTDMSLLLPIFPEMEAGEKFRVFLCKDGHQVPLILNVRNLVKRLLDVDTLSEADIGSQFVFHERMTHAEAICLSDAARLQNAGETLAFKHRISSEGLAFSKSWIHFFLAGSYQKDGDLDPALRHFEAAIALDPSYAMSWFGRGECLEGLGRYHEAAASWQTLALLKPQSIQFRRRNGLNLMRVGDLKGARKEFEAILALKPDDDGAIRMIESLSRSA